MAEDESRRKQELHIADYALGQAQKCLQTNNDGKAFANFLLVFKLVPEKGLEYKTEFLQCLSRWIKTLRDSGRIQDMLTCQHEACMVLPNCPELFDLLGTELFKLGYLEEAATYFRKALSADPTFFLARYNLQNLCGHMVERWHFRMLNDRARNAAYRQAIQRAVQEGYKDVLDIGAGTGVLSMYAAEAGADHVYACEMSKTMYDISCECVKTNLMMEKITLIHKKSTDLSIPENIPQRISLLVTETFDAGLFGEHILSSLSHAWDNLLQKSTDKKARVIPCRASLYVCAIECEAIRKQSRSVYPGARHLTYGDCQITKHPEPLDEPDSGDFEPYTCHRLSDLPGGYKILSKKLCASNISFDDPEMIKKYLDGYTEEHSITVTSNGQLDALAVWFDLDLDDKVTLTSDPQAGSCWEQAVYPVFPSQLKGFSSSNCSMLVRKEDKVLFSLNCKQNVLRLDCSEIAHHRPEKYPAEDMQGICQNQQNDIQADSHVTETTKQACQTLALSRQEISRLNDLTWNQNYCKALEDARSYLSSTSHSSSKCSVLSIIKDFTILPLQALKIGYNEVCLVTDTERTALDKLSELNDISPSHLKVEENLEDVTGDWDVIIADIVEPSGCLRQQVMEDIALTRMTHLAPGGVVVPNLVSIYGMLIESASLIQDSMVTSDDNTLGIQVQSVINDFQMTQHMDVCLSTLHHKKLSEPFLLLDFDLNQPLPDDGDIESTFLQQDHSFVVRATECGTVCAVVYWFDLRLSPSIYYSTLDNSSHIRQAALIQKEPFDVSTGAEISIRAMCKNSCLDIIVADPYCDKATL